MRTAEARLAPFLERIHAQYDGGRFTDHDPISVPMSYGRPEDQEVMAFVAASLAFGNVKAILGALTQLREPLGEHPARTLVERDRRWLLRITRGFRYRWIDGQDMANLLGALGEALRNHGGLEPLFARGQVTGAPDVLSGAASLVEGLLDYIPPKGRARRGTRYLLTDVRGGSAAKRIHMFLRWMIREAPPDLGLWKSASTSQLVMPMDTHTARISRFIGLTDRTIADGAMAQEVTIALRGVDPEDPVCFDFGLSRLGILGHCEQRWAPEVCPRCPLEPVCRLAASRQG